MSNKPPIEVPQGAIRLNTDSQKLEFFAQDRWYEMATNVAIFDGGDGRGSGREAQDKTKQKDTGWQISAYTHVHNTRTQLHSHSNLCNELLGNILVLFGHVGRFLQHC